MLIHSEQEMLEFGRQFGANLQAPAVIELLGDVGAGKTTFVRGLAAGLGVIGDVTSPSFTLSKTYQGSRYRLIHYDFYRLGDPGIMSDDLAEAMRDPSTIVVVEWGQSVYSILPNERTVIEIKYVDENTREITVQ